MSDQFLSQVKVEGGDAVVGLDHVEMLGGEEAAEKGHDIGFVVYDKDAPCAHISVSCLRGGRRR